MPCAQIRRLLAVSILTAVTATGAVTATASAQQAPAQPPPDGDLTSISAGESGTLVAWWQDRLNDWIALADADIDPLAVDGIYGPNTQAATTKFQLANGTVDADGIVHPADRVALESSISTLQSGEVSPGAAVNLVFDGLAVPVASACWLATDRFSASTVGEITVTVTTTNGTLTMRMDAEGEVAETNVGTTEVVGSSMRYTGQFGPNAVGPQTVVVTLNATPTGCA